MIAASSQGFPFALVTVGVQLPAGRRVAGAIQCVPEASAASEIVCDPSAKETVTVSVPRQWPSFTHASKTNHVAGVPDVGETRASCRTPHCAASAWYDGAPPDGPRTRMAIAASRASPIARPVAGAEREAAMLRERRTLRG